MKKPIVFTAFLFCVFALQAQSTNHDVKVGDILVLGEPSGSSYISIEFPRKNIITKRGAIPNFKALVGQKVVVKEIANSGSDSKTIAIVRKDGLNFFRFFPSVRADLNKALESGELKTTQFSGQNAIAQK